MSEQLEPPAPSAVVHKIPDALKGAILRMSGQGASSQDVATWLDSQGVQVTARAVRKFLNKVADERAPTAMAVTAEQLGKTLVADLEALEDIKERARETWQKAQQDGDYRGAAAALSAENAAIQTCMKARGLGGDRGGGSAPGSPASTTTAVAAIVILPAEAQNA